MRVPTLTIPLLLCNHHMPAGQGAGHHFNHQRDRYKCRWKALHGASCAYIIPECGY